MIEADSTLADIVAAARPDPAAYAEAARRVQSEAGALQPLRVAVMATSTVEPIRPYLVVEGAVRGLIIQPRFLPFNQLELQVLDPSSELRRESVDAIVIACGLNDFAPRLTSGFVGLSSLAIDDEVRAVGDRLGQLLDGIRGFTDAALVLFNFGPEAYLAAGLADPMLEPSQASTLQRVNDVAAGLGRTRAGVSVLDYARLVVEHGLRHWVDPRLVFRGRIPFGVVGQQQTGRALARHLRATQRPPCKCLVLDLDNTLWGGVLGEDGPQGIALGEDHPGNVFKSFQRAVLALKDRGVLLALASKNDEAEARAVINGHPDCLLRTADFSAFQVNWNDKASSLAAIAAQLSIGIDALAFFDDSPQEREWVRSRLPAVTVIDVPASPLGYVHALMESGAFDHLSLTAEDRVRAELYRQEDARAALQSQHATIADFLADLGLKVTIGGIGPSTQARAAQLIAKTNQFNVTVRRHSEAELQALLAAGAEGLWMRVSDRYGDAGLVGLAIAVATDDGVWELDTLLLSCRVIGRQVETALLAQLAARVRARGGRMLDAKLVRTPKNAPAHDVFDRHGFDAVGDGHWRLPLDRTIERPEFLEVTVDES